MNTSGLQAAVVLPTLADLSLLPLLCAFGAEEASDSIGGGGQKKNSNTYLSTVSGEVQVYVERTSDTKLGELRAALNLWIKKSRPEDKLVELLTKPICEQKRWWALIDEDTRQHIDSLRRALET